MKENQITLIQADGTEELATILFTHETETKNYVVFEFEHSNEISAAVYIENEAGEGELVDIETEEEWEMLDELLDQYFSELEDEELEDEEFED